MSSGEDPVPADSDKHGQDPNTRRLRLVSDGAALTPATLSELEIAMLEMIDFGIDQWASTPSSDIAQSLMQRGLIDRQEPSDPAKTRNCYIITALGRQSLASARGLSSRPTNHSRAV
jgi:hypothetical protein